jgi:tRNA dimethylallyltransferase
VSVERSLAPLALYGPTGVGKTRVAVELCRRLGGEIIGADSVQVYRGFDIGSGKPTAAELGEVPHHLIDVLDAGEAIDAARYAALADAAIASVQARGHVPVIVGGTGLWLRALLRGLVLVPPKDAALRTQLEAAFDADPGASYAQLRTVDPISAARIHRNDKLRVVRALEVHAQTGEALGALRREHAHGAPRHRALLIALDLEDPHYGEAIEARTRGMFERGLLAEVEQLVARHGKSARPLQSVGYRQVLEHLEHGVALDETQRRVVQATRLYARKQRNWARTEPDVALRVRPAALLEAAAFSSLEAHVRGR